MSQDPAVPSSIPVVAQVPPGIVSLLDHEAHALTLLDANAQAYFAGAAADELTLAANRRAWDEILLQPRILRKVEGGHTRVQLLGRSLAHPILLAPVAYQRLAHPDGELASAYAAAALGAGIVLSTQASVALEDVARAAFSEAGRGPLWFQLYPHPDRSQTRELVGRVEQAGYEALVVTVDAPINGTRNREHRVNFKLPSHIRAVNLAGRPLSPRIVLQPGQSSVFDGLLKGAPTWDDIEWLRVITKLPILIKGVMHADDARQAASLGAAGVIVSNHGGRTLDTAPASARVLPRIVQAIDGKLPVLVDGGIRRGTDVLKAMALGASAVLLGRPYVYGLANAGAVGVAHVLRLLRDELEVAMALCGCATLDDAGPHLLFER